jgi:hypothetical protein
MEIAISAITGPFGALVISVGILYWIGNRFIPILQKYFDGQNEQLIGLVKALNKTVDAHEKDRKAFEEAISTLAIRIEKVEEEVEDIKFRVSNAN